MSTIRCGLSLATLDNFVQVFAFVRAPVCVVNIHRSLLATFISPLMLKKLDVISTLVQMCLVANFAVPYMCSLHHHRDPVEPKRGKEEVVRKSLFISQCCAVCVRWVARTYLVITFRRPVWIGRGVRLSQCMFTVHETSDENTR